MSEAAGLAVLNAFANLRERLAYWQRYTPVELPIPTQLELDSLSATLGRLRKASLQLTAAKRREPLELHALPNDWVAARDAWLALCAELTTTLSRIPSANAIVSAFKAEAAKQSSQSVTAEVAQLQIAQRRAANEIKTLCDAVHASEKEKAALVEAKAKAKLDLDSYDAAVLLEYEASVNQYLKVFGASFRLTGSGKNYVGKQPQSEFGVVFDVHTVQVSTKASHGVPTFRTALSAGDKSTLALAFFLAQLDRDPGISSRVVVLDDPFTSLDEFRREMTAKEIVRIGQRASQVIVLSHDKHFVDSIRRKVIDGGFAAFQISLSGKDACIEPFDVEREIKDGYLVDHLELTDFAEGQAHDARKAVRQIRQLLEAYIRYRFPNSIPDGKWLGDMLAIIRDDNSHPLTGLYGELDDINAFTSPFHHDPNAGLDADEVRAFARRAFGVVGGA